LGCADDDCDGFVEAGGLQGHAGGMITPRLAILGDVWSMGQRDGRLSLNQTIVTAAARWWPTSRIWLSGGIGVARASFSYDADVVDIMDRSDTVPGYMGAVGLEVISSSTFALDLQLRAGTGVYEEDSRIRNAAVSVAANWY
jgi:hypothetical protein